MLSKIIGFLLNYLAKEKSLKNSHLCDFKQLRSELQCGDVLLVEDHSYLGKRISTVSGSQWNHAALYLGKLHDIKDKSLRQVILSHYPFEPDTPLLLESRLGKGVIIRALSHYEPMHLRICRPASLSSTVQTALLNASVREINYFTNTGLFDLLRFFMPLGALPRPRRLPFLSYKASNTTQLASSNAIARIFESIQYPIYPLIKKQSTGHSELFLRQADFCLPRDFDTSPYFEIIKYSFLDSSAYKPSKLQTWVGEQNVEKTTKPIPVSLLTAVGSSSKSPQTKTYQAPNPRKE